MKEWKKEIELASGEKIIAARTDNAPELLQAIREWSSGARSETTTIASSHQNGPAERNIRTAEADMRAMLKEASLPLEFWDEAVEHDAYIRNRTNSGPDANGIDRSPTEAFTGTIPDLGMCKVWGSKCYAYINPKTIPKGQRHDKLRDTSRAGVFLGYSKTTNRHVKVYSPELGYTFRSSRVVIDESCKGGDMDLKLRNCESGPQGTKNMEPDRRSRGRPAANKATIPITIPDTPSPTPIEPFSPMQIIPNTKIVSNAPAAPTVELKSVIPDISIPSYDEDENGNIQQTNEGVVPDDITSIKPTAEDTPTQEPTSASPEPAPEADFGTVPKSASEPISTGPETAIDMQSPEEQEDEMEYDMDPPRYLTRKRKREMEGNPDGQRYNKIVRALIAMAMEAKTYESDEHAMVAIPSFHTVDPYIKNKIVTNFTTLLQSKVSDEDTAYPASEVLGIKIPRTYNEAVSDRKYAVKWKEAIQEEINSLVQNGTWEEFILPKGSNLVSTKWVFTIKTKDNKVERFKARLVARGFSQVLGKDYNETFAPTMRLDTLRLFLAIVAKENLECSHFDIKNAFTESHLKEEIYLEPPQGVKVERGHVLKALRSLYGLKQAGRDWSLLLKMELLKMDFVQSLADPCLYTSQDHSIMLLVYVDDIVVASHQKSQIERFGEELSTRFNTKNLGEISKILGVRIIRDRKAYTLTMDQEEYLDAMLNKFGITHGQHQAKKVPVADYTHLRPANDDDELTDVNEYQQAIGSVIHPMVYTRPDIAFAVGRLSQFMAKPAKHHSIALKNLMRYLRSTVKQKLWFGPKGVQSDICKEYNMLDDTIKVYTDADWANDKQDRKSVSGGVVMFYGGPISWASKKQTSVATSSAEAEYIAMAMFTKQGRWIAQILKDLSKSGYIGKKGDTVQMLGDNQGALALTKNPRLHERSKHIDISYHFIRDLTEKEKIATDYINTCDMVADGMTKPCTRVAFERFKKMLGLVA
ncbi:hypothetical protein SS1G_12167 [Sclerotinia sclerotiorum 1980 UF-70]|nr:hypothetical protein SS1G_12167 [Sclerotinia sclerotiorum 1980 UF-70]XP_001590322.1 hypothetical protein SS1G_09087 [Sclerotinia sclerotiorum 1980 UF-70]EDN93221.1 hypothetical protein SS1G_09087 [Sclerotinia sclerotiorum 1980 UF-70]EDN95961.1 hypothetical protein SS1G_12167 [Sclerotinia sclerotiorum 1980 UF-70]